MHAVSAMPSDVERSGSGEEALLERRVASRGGLRNTAQQGQVVRIGNTLSCCGRRQVAVSYAGPDRHAQELGLSKVRRRLCHLVPCRRDSVHHMVVPRVLRCNLLADIRDAVSLPCVWSWLCHINGEIDLMSDLRGKSNLPAAFQRPTRRSSWAPACFSHRGWVVSC